jgi:putative ABC transport system permease protein
MGLTTLRVLLARLLNLFRRDGADARLGQEIQSHLDFLTDNYIAQGMAPPDARAAARRAFGGVDQVRALYRDQQGLPFVDALTQDLRFALRLLRREPGFATTAIAVLGLGIGVNNMLFTILDAHTLRGLPIRGVDRVVHLSTIDDRNSNRGLSYLDFQDVRNGSRSFAGLAVFRNATVNVGDHGRSPERAEGAFVSENAFTVLGIQPALGRGFAPEDDRPATAPVALLGEGLWQSRYGGDRSIVGRSILVNGAPAIVVGVVPDRSGFPSGAQVWLPLWQTTGLATQKRDARNLGVFGRVRDGVPVAQARAEVEAIADRLSHEYPDTNRNVRARVIPINERFLGRLTDPAWLAFMTVGFLVVIISCANVANLMLARSLRRAREIAIRTSLGASRGRVMRQLLIEGVVLAGIGGFVGLGVAMVGVRLFRAAMPADALPYWFDYSLDWRVIAALGAVSLGAVLIFALVPAIQASKTDVNRVLKDGGHASASRRTGRWTTAFLAAEFALVVVLLAQMSISFRLARPALLSDRVIETDDVLTAALTLPSDTYKTTDQRLAFYRRLEERLGGPAVGTAVSLASVLPLSGADEQRLAIAGRPETDAEPRPTVSMVAIAPRYFETLGLTLIRGREFLQEDGSDGHPTAIVNERLAQLFLGDGDPVGQRIALSPAIPGESTPAWLTVVGVSPTIRQRPGSDGDAIVYLPYRAAPPATASLIMRSHGDTDRMASLLRSEVLTIDPNLPLYRMRTMARVVRDAEWNGRIAHALLVVLICIAVGLSTVGLFAVTAHSVSQRTPEIGIRMALGAQPLQVVRLILRGAIIQLGAGFIAGVGCTVLWDRIFTTGRPEITATDPQSLLFVAIVLTASAAIACFIPARRATRLNPVVAIRGE